MKKRIIGLLTAAAMLFSALPVFAGGEIPAGSELVWFNDGTSISEFENAGTVMSGDVGAVKMTLTDTDQSKIWQAAKTNLSASTTAIGTDATAVLNFKIKAGSTDKYFWLTIGDEANGSQLTTLAMTSDGYMSAPSDSTWVSDKSTLGTLPYAKEYIANKWYDVAMAIRADHKMEYYLDGEKWFTATIPDTFDVNSANLSFRPGIKFSDKFAEPGTAEFWLDDISWVTVSENSFYAYADNYEYSGDHPEIDVKFTEQVTNRELASNVKVYNAETGEETAASASFTGARNMKVAVNAKLSSAAEYRIELPEFAGVLGKKVYNDNVYFLTENAGETVININETFDSFTNKTLDYYASNADNSYYYPDGWYLGFRWADQTRGLVKPVEETGRGKVMRFGKKTAGTEATSSIYYPMPEKVDSGVTHISFDIKPEAYEIADTRNFAALTTLFTLYPETLSPAERDYTDGNGNTTCKIQAMSSQVPLLGIVGNRLAFTTKNIFNVAGTERWGALSSWVDEQDKSITNPDNSTWYTVKVDIDWSSKTIKYNLNDQVTYESATILETLGLQNGFGGIGFYTDYEAKSSSALIDNVKIETDLPACGKMTTIIANDDFSSYTTGTSLTDGEVYAPDGWATSYIYLTQPSVTLKPNTMTQADGTEGTAVKIAKAGPYGSNNDGGSVAIYKALGKKISSGVLTIEYDINAASVLGSSDMNGKALHQLVLNAYPDVLTSEETSFANSGNMVGNPSKLKYLGGIQGGAMFVAKDTGTLTDGSGYINADYRDWGFTKNTWHHVCVMLDYDTRTVSTMIDSTNAGSAYALSSFGLENGISAIGFNQAWNAQATEICLDNVKIKHTEDLGGSKMQSVRFVDGKGNKYGLSNSVPTLAEKIEINFLSAVDVASLNGSIALTDSRGNSIALNNGVYDEKTNTYTVSLAKLMNKNTQYTLSSRNITSGGKNIDDYSTTFNTDVNGAFEVSQLYIKKNGAVVEKGEFAVGDVITVGVKALNSTGVDEYVTFVYSVYNGNQMIKCGLDEATVGEAQTIYTKEFTFTVDSELAANMTDISGFAWGDIGSVIPLTDFVSLKK